MHQQTSATQSSYDRVAAEYVARITDELEHKPLDRHLLGWFAERVQGLGPVCDVGCGPGHVAHYLQQHGLTVYGLDLSPEMIAHARQRYPEIVFTQGDMRALDVADATFGGMVAFYSLIHIPRDQIVAVLRELRRVLRPGGALLVAFHIGRDILHLDSWWEQPVALDFMFFPLGEMVAYLTDTGFEIEAVIERAPYAGTEHPSQRAYICAGIPAQSRTE